VNHLNSELIDKVKRSMLAMQRKSWEQGVAALALLELGDEETVILMMHDAVVHQSPDGRLALVDGINGVADPVANYEPLLFAARKTGDLFLMEASERMRSYMTDTAPRTADGIISHVDNVIEIWSDSFFMIPTFFITAGMPAEGVRHFSRYREMLYDPGEKLLRHIWSETESKFILPQFWGGGNGWAAAGMARALRILPQNMEEERETIRIWLTELLESCLTYMRPDGLFHDIIDDSKSFVETNLSQMLAYAIYTAVNCEWLDNKFIPFADIMRNAALKKIDNFGLVRGTCGAPRFISPGTSVEAQAFTILMETAAAKSKDNKIAVI
jgi:unsaturated rhamnogalacturonyl hydrolase